MIDYILITGYARSGKDTFVDALCESLLDREHNAEIIRLSEPIKEIADKITNCLSDVDSTQGRNTPIKDFGYTPRKLWQVIGTELFQHGLMKHSKEFRKLIGKTIWCKYLYDNKSGNAFTIIPDVRFQHEIDYFKSKGNCFIINIRRFSIPWYKRIFLHESERNIHKLPFNIQVDNKGTKDELEQTAKFIAGSAIFNREGGEYGEQ